VAAEKPGQRSYRAAKRSASCARSTGIKGLIWHDLRRTCGYRRLQDDRWPIERVPQFLGHQNVQVTRQHFAFLNVEHQLAEMKRSG
jgi:integrase